MENLFAALILLCVLVSCNKPLKDDSHPPTLVGEWYMNKVKDKHTGVTTPKPANDTDKVYMILQTSGSFLGITLTNNLSSGKYTLSGTNHITMNLVENGTNASTPWAKLFANNIGNIQTYQLMSFGLIMLETPNVQLYFERKY